MTNTDHGKKLSRNETEQCAAALDLRPSISDQFFVNHAAPFFDLGREDHGAQPRCCRRAHRAPRAPGLIAWTPPLSRPADRRADQPDRARVALVTEAR